METTLNIKNIKQDAIGHIKYAIFFADESVTDVSQKDGVLIVTHDSDEQKIIDKVNRIIQRFSNDEFGFKEEIIFVNRVELPYKENIMSELIENKIVRELGPGMFTFREPFTTLLRFFDDYFVKRIGKALNAKEEYYPVVIHAATLDKTNHFTSFPEHIHFITHLREDLDVIERFSEDIKKAGGWKSESVIDVNSTMVKPGLMINPATCYHCYEALQDELLDGDGIVVTAVSKAHRFESKNHRDFGRLLDFTLREIIFVGRPEFVKENRAKSLEMLMDILTDWEIDSTVENANDPFFTNDFNVKASFQRNQGMKYEVRMTVPYINKSIAVSSSNFHSTTFGNAFNIKVGKRPAVTACLGFGLERWVMAFLAQYSLDKSKWPSGLMKDFNEWSEKNGL